MTENPNKLSNFWQELKRRRVIHVITVYATAAFVIIELVNNLAEPLNLPARLPIIVVVVLAIGFPLAIILSWLYDLTSEGVERTKPLSEIKEEEKTCRPQCMEDCHICEFCSDYRIGRPECYGWREAIARWRHSIIGDTPN